MVTLNKETAEVENHKEEKEDEKHKEILRNKDIWKQYARAEDVNKENKQRE